MNKQAAYILYAHLILTGIIASVWLFSKIPARSEHATSSQIIDIDIAPARPGKEMGSKRLFNSKCAACHSLFKNDILPIANAINNDHWADRKQLYKWIRNPDEFMKHDPYTRKLKEQFGSTMSAFPDLTNEEIDEIVKYIQSSSYPPAYEY